ncbi:MAG TPA: YdcF family protein [Lapidilactobacillus dextrinicus]|uniref:YdcF family protein n=1 Tax=Lapidilactobacillus dextrinicus TaxID=51664 RepID=A0A921B4K4_9LACO|nr:YdcF family protein [Lapidilactobacillus dextrinicus]
MEQFANASLGRLIGAVLIIGAIMLIFFGIFLYNWLKEPRRLVNGTLFSLFFGVFLVWLAVLIFNTGNEAFITFMGILFLILVAVVALTLLMGWLLLFWNAAIVWKRESHTLANMLTLLLAIFLLVIWVIDLLNTKRFLPDWLNALLSVLPAIGTYLFFCSYNYLLNALLYQFVPRNYRQDYLIVLGAGLIDGHKVSRLLGSRIDRALVYAKKQEQKGRPLPKIVFSGGQGGDELLPEAKAMADYAVEHGWPQELVLLEDRSKNTLQNMAFSKEVIAADFKTTTREPQVKFFTNNYHTFRAGIYARMADLKANGVGSKVRLYFLPNALIREFVAVFLMHKRRHMIVVGSLLIIGLFSAIIAVLN